MPNTWWNNLQGSKEHLLNCCTTTSFAMWGACCLCKKSFRQYCWKDTSMSFQKAVKNVDWMWGHKHRKGLWSTRRVTRAWFCLDHNLLLGVMIAIEKGIYKLPQKSISIDIMEESEEYWYIEAIVIYIFSDLEDNRPEMSANVQLAWSFIVTCESSKANGCSNLARIWWWQPYHDHG